MESRPNIIGLARCLGPDLTAKRLDEAIDALSKCPHILLTRNRLALLAILNASLEKAERTEEAPLVAAEAEAVLSLAIAASPAAILGVRFCEQAQPQWECGLVIPVRLSERAGVRHKARVPLDDILIVSDSITS